MNVSVLVCTYGRKEWAVRGHATAKTIQGAREVIALHEDDDTLAGVRNLAAAAASGDWLCFVDADDRLDDGHIEAMAAAEAGLYRHGLVEALLVPAVSFVGPGGCSDPAIPAWDRSIYDVNCAVIGTLVPRLLFARVGGFDEWPAYEDWELWLRCIAAGVRLVPVPEAVYCARAQEGREGRNAQAPEVLSRAYADIRGRHARVAPNVWEDAKL